METDPSRWHGIDGVPGTRWQADGDGAEIAGTITAGPRTDWFVDPATGQPTASAPLLLTPVDGDAQLSALVRADLRSTFDAVALFVHAGPTTWAKLALERSPAGEDTVVTVVTRGVSDDANGPAVPEPGQAWLRVSRVGEVYTFHHSVDGETWSLARLFTLGGTRGHRWGLTVQSPLGDGLAGRVEQVRLTPTTLADPRDGR